MINRTLPRKLAVDTDERSMQPGDLKQAVNITIDADSDGDSGVVKFVDGNVAIEPSDPNSGIPLRGVNTVIGSVADEELGVIYFFVHNSDGDHGVYAYSDKTKTYRVIFRDVSLDFDKEGFVKGDIVRIKKRPELVQAQINVSQGTDGAVVPDDGGGFGPISANPAKKLTIKVVKDLTAIVELHGSVHDLTSAADYITADNFRLNISGSYVPETTSQPIRFYSQEVDLNLNPEFVESLSIAATSISFVVGQGLIEFEFDVFIDPDVANGDFSMTYSIENLNVIPTQTASLTAHLAGGLTLNTKTLSQDDFSGDVYDESSSPRVLGVEGKFRDNVTVADVFDEIPSPISDNLQILSANTTLANNYVDPSGSGVEIQSSDDRILDRTAKVTLKIDYTGSAAMAAAIEYLEWLNYNENGPDDWPNEGDVPDFNRKSLLDDPGETISYAVVTRCPYSLQWRLWAHNGGSLPRYDADGISFTYNQLVNNARQQLNGAVQVSAGINNLGELEYPGAPNVPSYFDDIDDSENYYSSLDAAAAAASLSYGVPYSGSFNNFTYYGVVLVPYVTGENDGTFGSLAGSETITCNLVSPDAIFNPKIFVIPVTENTTDPARSYSPRNFPTIDSLDAWAQYLTNPVKTFDIDVPIAGPLDGTTRDVIVVAYNDGISQFEQQEDVANTSLYSYAFQPTFSNGSPAPTTTEGVFSTGSTTELLALENSVTYSFSGNPAEIGPAKGRRMRIPIKRNSLVLPSAGLLAPADGSGERNKVVCVPFDGFGVAFEPNISEKFCFGTGFSCTDPSKTLSLIPAAVSNPPIIEQGEETQADATTQDDSTIISVSTSTSPTTTKSTSTTFAKTTLSKEEDKTKYKK